MSVPTTSSMVERVAAALEGAENANMDGDHWANMARAAIEATGWEVAMHAAFNSLWVDGDIDSAILILKTALKE